MAQDRRLDIIRSSYSIRKLVVRCDCIIGIHRCFVDSKG